MSAGESAVRCTDILERMSDAYLALDSEWRITHANSRALHLLVKSREELIGRNIWDVFPELVDSTFYHRLRDAVEEDADASFEEQFEPTTRWFEVRAFPNSDDLSVYFTDVTEPRQAQRVLRECEERYRVVADYAYDWEYWLSEDGAFIYVSPSCERITGHSAQEFVQDPSLLTRIVHPDDREHVVDHLKACVPPHRTHPLDFRIVRPDGEVRWISHVCSPVCDEHGRCTGTRASNHDVTERKRTEDAMKESQARLQATLRSTADEMWIVDAEGRIVLVSDSVREHLGVAADRWDDIHAALDQLEVLRPDGTPRPREDALLLRSLRGEVIVREEEMIRNVATGELRWREVSSTPTRDPGGRIIGAVAVVRDITDRKRVEEALEAERARLRTVLATLPIGVFIADRSGRMVEINDAGRDIWGGNVPLAEGVSEYVQYKGWRADTGEQYKAEDWALARALTRGETVVGEVIDIERFDGTCGTILNSAAPIRDEQGRITGAVVTVQDITDLRVAEQALLDAERDLNRAQAVAKTGSWMLDIRHNALIWSDETYRIFDVPKGTALTYEKFLGFIHPDDREYVDREWQEALRGAPYDIEHRICAGNTVKWVRETAELDLDEQGNLLSGFGTVRDITDRKQIEQALESDRRRIAVLENISEAGISSLDMGEVLGTLAVRVREGMNSHSSHIMVLDDKTGELVTQATCNVPRPVGFRTARATGFIGKIYTERRTVYIADAQNDPLVVEKHVRRAGIRSLLGTPLVIGDRAIGVVYVDMLEVHEFSADDVSLLESMASRIAPAIENARLYDEVVRGRSELEKALERESYFSLQLQRALLPPAPEIGEGYAVAHTYLSPYAGREVGGDFYDVFRTEAGCVGIVIGDVSGKGLEAASVAAATRATVRAFAYDLSSAGEALTHTNLVMYAQQPDSGLTFFVTVFLAILHPATGEISYSSAGHPPPAVYHAESGGISFLEQGNPPIGILARWDYEEGTAQLHPHDKLVLYTDGLSEARRDNQMFEVQGIERVLREHGTEPPTDVVGELVSQATEWAEGYLRDDTAVLIIERER